MTLFAIGWLFIKKHMTIFSMLVSVKDALEITCLIDATFFAQPQGFDLLVGSFYFRFI